MKRLILTLVLAGIIAAVIIYLRRDVEQAIEDETEDPDATP